MVMIYGVVMHVLSNFLIIYWNKEGIPKRNFNNRNSVSCMQGIILKLVDSIKSFTAQLNIIRDETTAVKDKINSIKKKNEL